MADFYILAQKSAILEVNVVKFPTKMAKIGNFKIEITPKWRKTAQKISNTGHSQCIGEAFCVGFGFGGVRPTDQLFR